MFEGLTFSRKEYACLSELLPFRLKLLLLFSNPPLQLLLVCVFPKLVQLGLRLEHLVFVLFKQLLLSTTEHPYQLPIEIFNHILYLVVFVLELIVFRLEVALHNQ